MKNIGKINKRIVTVLTAFILTVFTTSPVYGLTDVESEGINPDAKGSITIERPSDREWPVNGTVFHLYQVAVLKDDMTFAYTEEFKDSEVTLPAASHSQDSSWEDTTKELVTEVNQNHLKPLESGTWANGSLTFSSLDQGLYLLTADETVLNGKKYTSQGNLISVPNRNEITDDWKYDIQVEVKYSYETLPATPTPKPTPTPVPEKPDTRDTFNEWLYAGVVIAMGVVIGIVIYIRSKEKED